MATKPKVNKIPSTAQKPLYGRVLASRAFRTREEATAFAQKIKDDYSVADISIKFDVTRTENSEWKATVYAKV